MDYIYIIHSTSGHYKIGRSSDPQRRLSQLKATEGPFEYSLVNVLETNDANEAEKEFHAKFASKRVRGEWFSVTAEDLGLLLTEGAYVL